MNFSDSAQLDNFTLELGSGSETGLALALAIMMFAVALGLRAEHFAFFKHSPRVFIVGLVGQLLVLPGMTLALCYLLTPAPSIALGMILIACCPGGNVSNMLVIMARGSAALSVSLTATSSVAAAFVTPFAIVFWSGLYPPTSSLLTKIDFDSVHFLAQTALILALPLGLGLLLVRHFPKVAEKLRGPMLTTGGVGLLLIIVFATLKYLDEFILICTVLIGLVALHNACAFFAGYVLARLVQADQPSVRAITFEVGIQNSGLGIVILLTQMGGLGGAAAVAALWGIWHIVAGVILVGLFRLLD